MRKRTIIIRIIAALALLLALIFIVDYVSYPHLHPLEPCTFNSGNNGLWLRYYWYAGKHNDADFEAMIHRLTDNQIRYAYFHVLNAKSDGHLRVRKLAEAQKITRIVHERAPGTKPIAWLYIGSAARDGGVDLTKPQVRKNLVDEALWLTGPCAFDGVQWDYEFAADNGEGLLKLLEETRAALPKNKMVSAATPMWYPGTLWGWSDDYFKKICRHCDQVALMCYDSYLYLPRAYVWLVAEQAKHATDDCAGTNCKVILGLPTYEDVTLAHHAHVESLENALRGVSIGLSDSASRKMAFDGIALFADYTTDENEWADYKKYWLGK